MSPDDIFAAQFWPWPDPAIKRDPQGRVLFVNAAFLGLYGGRVEDWRGNAIGGWPAPQPVTPHGVAPYRFETRLPAQDGSEQVYDWMEQTLADGNAFALARNVTVFVQSPDPTPGEAAIPDMASYTEQPAQAPAADPSHLGAIAQASDPILAQTTTDVSVPDVQMPAVESPAPALEAPVASFEPPLFEEPVLQVESEAPTVAVPDIPVPQIDIPQVDIPSDDAYAMTQAPAAAPVATQTEEREYERRALPIENESAVLGNNWRDAVIAKAIGAGDVAPSANPEDVPATSTPETIAEGGPIRILLAEDNAINALLTRTLLEAEGHSVDTVEDGQLAVEAMKTSTYDLIFMDMRMPNMDGLEATRKIRTLPNVGKRLPIIALTANAFDDDRNACFDSGMNDFMTKPVSAEELSEKVRDWTSAEAKERLAKAA